MDKKISVEDLDGLKKVHEIMVELTLPNINADALKTVGKLEGQKFKQAIVAIANNEDNMNHSRNYVGSVTCLLTGPVQQMLTSMGYVNLHPETLIKMGKECGREFRQHLSAASTGNHESKQWIQKKITEHGSSAPEQGARSEPPPQAKPAPAARPNNVADINQRRPEPDFSRDNNPYPNAAKGNHESSRTSQDKTDRDFFSVTFYGGKSAICFNATEKDGEFSINVDGGNKKPNQPEGGRAIDWQDKVVFGFSSDELIELAWVLLGVSDSCKFSGHGPAHDKSFQFNRQDTGYFGSVSAKDKGSRAVPMSHAAGTRLMFLVSRQIQKNYPNMTVTEVLAMLTRMAKPRPNAQPRAANG
jgi:hypothetical protein